VRIVVHREIPDDPFLGQRWDTLVEAMDRPEVFYTYEWALAVFRAYSKTLTPLLILGYEGEHLVGVASLATSEEGKTVFLAHATSDYCDFVSWPGERDALVEGVFAELRRRDLAMLTMANFPANSRTRAALREASRANGYTMFSRPAYDCARVLLGSQEQRKTLKESLVKRKALRYALKGLAKQGPVQIRHLRSWQEIESALPDFMQAHIARFGAMGRVSNIAYPARQRFLTELAKLLAPRDWIALTRMRVGECTVAWNYGFRFAGSWFYYQPTFDTGLQQYSPGVCLLSKMLEEACDDTAIDLIDLGLGAECYKERFANGIRQTLHVTLATSAATCFRERVRYQAATVVKSVPRLENWIRSFLGQASMS
jgi:CelD/BcsL family acetyltransferase involved in cellulose biosynthesis